MSLVRISARRFEQSPYEEWLIAHSEGFDVEISDPNSRVLLYDPEKRIPRGQAEPGADNR